MSGSDGLQPPSNQDGPFGYEPDGVSYLDAPEDQQTGLDDSMAQRLARESFTASTEWMNSGRRNRWSDSLRAFQSLHAAGSKYLSRDWLYRSNLYRPKTRSMVRRDESETAAAFFSNEDVVSITATQQDDPKQQASAEMIKALLQYRLTHTVPWFLTVVGARQDCDVMGISIGKVYWKYETVTDGYDTEYQIDPVTGEVHQIDTPITRVIKDTPCVDLVTPENMRFDPASDWRDPINTSSYLIEQIPMTVQDVQSKMDSGEWRTIPTSSMRSTGDVSDDTTRRAREANRVPGKDDDTMRPGAYDICWVRFNIVNYKGIDYAYYTGGGQCSLLTDPVPLTELFANGRPYVCGFVNIETHKAYPASKVELFSDLQRAANDQWNLRFDNVKLALNPRQFVREGSGIDVNDVRSFMPGKVVLSQNPREDVVWDRPPDVTASAYQEQSLLDRDFDDLAGDQTQSSMASNQLTQQSATGMHLVSGMAAGMTEYELRVFTETFVEPVLRKLIQLEQMYEDDEVIMSICANNAKLFQRFGVDKDTDDLLSHNVTTKVNVGIGATNSAFRLKRMNEAADTLGKLFGPVVAQGLNFEEVVKEVFGACGYEDGARFFKPGFDPQQAMQAMQQAKQAPPKPPQSVDPQEMQFRMQLAQTNNQSKEQIAQMRAQSAEQIAAMNAQTRSGQDQASIQKILLQQQHERQRAFNDHRVQTMQNFQQHAHETRTQNRNHVMDAMLAAHSAQQQDTGGE